MAIKIGPAGTKKKNSALQNFKTSPLALQNVSVPPQQVMFLW